MRRIQYLTTLVGPGVGKHGIVRRKRPDTVPDDEAARLVAAGMARYIDTDEPQDTMRRTPETTDRRKRRR